MANLELFVLDMKFKSRWKMNSLYAVFGCFLLSFCCLQVCEASSKCGGSVCDFGRCINGTCVCDEGWTGSTCSHCVGRVRLTANQGFISDGTGNYSVDAKCAWLVDSGSTNHTIRLHLKEFATECGWDHIFIHDGDSAFSPLTAAYSGRMVPKKPSNPKEIQTETEVHSGKAYIHFYSDAAYNIAGFNISYRFGGCRKDCSAHGVCANTTTAECECDAGWRGPGCDLVDCSQQCTTNATYCSPLCVCHHANKKSECEERERRGYWEPVFATSPPHPRTSHKAVVIGDHMWVVGGYNFNLQPFQNVVRYSFVDESWQSVTPGGEVLPEPRYGHSVVAYQGKLYMYGGVVGNTVTNALFVFNISSLTWSQEDYTVVDGLWHLPAGVAGHTAHVVDDTMLVVFGHSPVYGYMPNIQEYDFRSHKWRVVTTTGALVSGAYGHSSMYDPVSGLLYVFGGSSPEDKTVRLTDKLFAYNHLKRRWTILQRSYSPRYLHSAVFLGGLMLVFGGNTHNDTSGIKMAKCYSVDLLAYDLGTGCDSWKFLPQPDAHTANKLARYGHTSVVYNNEVYIFAGFSGVMLNDLYRYTPGNCSLHDDKVACQTSVSGVKCQWQNSACQENSSKQCEISSDPSVNSRFCGELASCCDCLAAGRRLCYWCGDKCSAKKCPDQSQVAECPAESSHRCNVTQNCELCKTEENCIWSNSSKCQYAPSSNSVSVKPVGKACKPACQSHSNCGNCTAADCMWCTNLQRCVDTNSYSASFPYGICMEWTMNEGKCPQTKCSELRSCADCQSNPRCGWCKDPRDTGLGACQEGGDSGDLGGTCPAHRWFFTSCPLCQCNGHSSCKNGTDICEACQSHTTGRNCERCKLGYFGDARLGGRCKPCECNGQADICATDTGDCFCRTKGMIGPRCDRCDEGNKYFGDPKSGTCYYDLATDYQYTFEMFKESDQFYTHINFMNIPIASDRDVDFRLNCSGKAMVNITWHSNSYPEEQMVMAPAMCGVVKRKFEHDAYNFDSSENTTFRIYVYDFKTPFSLQISFVVVSSFDIFLFVAIFIGCFLSLMLLAALLWKIKQRYDLYRRRQRMVVEMEQMASRPFAMVSAEIEPKIEAYINPAAMAIKRDPPDIKRKKLRIPNKPQPVAYEPLYGGKVAVVSLLVRLPTGDEDYTPPGQSGLAVASALVTLGTQRKPSIDKGDKSRTRNQRSTATQPHV